MGLSVLQFTIHPKVFCCLFESINLLVVSRTQCLLAHIKIDHLPSANHVGKRSPAVLSHVVRQIELVDLPLLRKRESCAQDPRYFYSVLTSQNQMDQYVLLGG